MSLPLTHLSLFSGYEGFGLALKLTGIQFRTIGYVEKEPYAQQVLQARMKDGLLDWAPIVRDIRTADFRPMAGLVDIVTAGFPCQGHSTAGRRRGADDPRNLWPDTMRCIREVAPRLVILENVEAITFKPNVFVATVLRDLATGRYDAEWDCLPACAVGAPHGRWRWWCLAYPAGSRREPWVQELQSTYH